MDVVVIGAGQAGLAAAYHSQRRGFVSEGTAASGTAAGGTAAGGTVAGGTAAAGTAAPTGPAASMPLGTYVVLDAEDGPGGAWRHRWQSLRMATVNGISDLPGIPKPDVGPTEPSSAFLTGYFGNYEGELGLAIKRPVKVRAVSREDQDPAGR